MTDVPTPANRRPLTEQERHTVLRTLAKPPNGWADRDGSPQERSRAHSEKRWHAFIDGVRRLRQDVVTGAIEVMPMQATRRQRRALAALERRQARKAAR